MNGHGRDPNHFCTCRQVLLGDAWWCETHDPEFMGPPTPPTAEVRALWAVFDGEAEDA